MQHQLYILRRENRLTQKDMAANLVVSKAAYQNKESGKSFFTVPEGIVLAKYFDVMLDELLISGN